MTLKVNIGLFVAGVLGCTFVLQRCNRPSTFKGPTQVTSQGDGDVLVVKQKGKPDVKIYQPDPQSTTITTDAKGNVTVHVRQFGVGFEPGIGVGYSNKSRLALDARLVYFKRFGGHAGLGFSLDPETYGVHQQLFNMVDPYLGVSYVPWLRFSNTSLVASYTASKHVFVFARWRF